MIVRRLLALTSVLMLVVALTGCGKKEAVVDEKTIDAAVEKLDEAGAEAAKLAEKAEGAAADAEKTEGSAAEGN